MKLTEKEVDYEKIQSLTIDWIRFPMALFVIYIHENPIITKLDLINLKLDSVFFNNLFSIIFCKLIGQICVPCFLFFSGYLFFSKIYNFNKIIYFSKLKSRFKTLIIPYLLFNILYIAIVLILSIDSNIDFNNYILELTKNWHKVFWNFNTWGTTYNIFNEPVIRSGPYLTPLWFLRDLIILIIISPIIYIITKYLNKYFVVILLILYLFKIFINLEPFIYRSFIVSLFFFTFGSYLAINKKNIIIEFRRYKYLFLFIFLVSLISSIFYYNDTKYHYLLPLFIISGIITIVNYVSLGFQKKILNLNPILSKSSFFIYCIHPILFLSYSMKITKILFLLILDSNNAVLATFLISPILCCSIIYFIYKLMLLKTPKILYLLTGNR